MASLKAVSKVQVARKQRKWGAIYPVIYLTSNNTITLIEKVPLQRANQTRYGLAKPEN